MMPMVCPERICRSMFSSASRFALAEYLNRTPSKSTEPSLTSVTASFFSVREGCSSSTSKIRFADSPDMVSVT